MASNPGPLVMSTRYITPSCAALTPSPVSLPAVETSSQRAPGARTPLFISWGSCRHVVAGAQFDQRLGGIEDGAGRIFAFGHRARLLHDEATQHHHTAVAGGEMLF